MKERMTVTIDKNVLDRLQKLADEEQRSLSGLVNRLLTKAVESKPKGGK